MKKNVNYLNNRNQVSANQMDIWLADLPLKPDSHVQGGPRPVLIVSNDAANEYSPVIAVVPLTTRMKRLDLSTHITLQGHGLRYPSLALVEQLTTIDKSLLVRRLGHVSVSHEVTAIKSALMNYMSLAA